jgi:hypothetical protein
VPRPANGYKNSADQSIPGVHDITSRYKETGGLLNWAYSQGKKGVPLYQANVLQIGHAVHRMAELDLRGAPKREVETVPYQMLGLPEDIDKAFAAFSQYQGWRKDHCIRALAFEEALVSEVHQFGGTFDIVALVDGDRSLLDFKTSKSASDVYLDQRLAMAAHGALWRENHSDLPLAGYHLIILPKDGKPFGHHAFADLAPELEMFLLQLDCWRIEKGLQRARSRRQVKAAPEPMPVLKSLRASVEALKPPRRTTRAKVKVNKVEVTAAPTAPQPIPMPMLNERPQSMAAILRQYGHITA